MAVGRPSRAMLPSGAPWKGAWAENSGVYAQKVKDCFLAKSSHKTTDAVVFMNVGDSPLGR